MNPLTALVIGAAITLAGSPAARADEPMVAGENVPAPKRTKFVQPTYPPEAQARGQRGIVIVELVIDTQGKVSSAQVVRSIPPFDEAALTAVRQWEYEVTKVSGRPVSVKLTVPITFAMRVPEIAFRQEGIPELRAGAFPPFPAETKDPQNATAEVTLGVDGGVEELRILEGAPGFADALSRALRTWRFAPDAAEALVTFRVHAQFVPAARGAASRVDFRLDGLRRSESVQAADTTPAAPTSAAPASAPPPAATPPPAPAPAPAPATSTAPPPAAVAPPAATAPAPAPASPAASAAPTAPSSQAPDAPRPPAMEVLNVPAPPPPPENGLSAIRDVTLAPGVPDLTKGRRPVPPPLARMSQATGTVEVTFSVDAAGIAAVKGSSGPDVFKRAAEQAVTSWTFRRTRADRIFLVAEFKYGLDAASAVVHPDVR